MSATVNAHPTTSILSDEREWTASSQLSLPLRFVLTGMLVGLLWKVAFFRIADQVYVSIPLHDSFFPVWLR